MKGKKIYLVMRGNSNIGICFVDKKKAEALVDKFNKCATAKFTKYYIEEYVDCEINESPIWEIIFGVDGDITNIRKMIASDDDFGSIYMRAINGLYYWNGGVFRIFVFAEDVASAIKMATKKRAKYLDNLED